MLILLGINVLRSRELFLGTLKCGLDGVLINLFLVDRILSQDMDAIALDLGETAADGQELSHAVFRYAQFAVLESG